LARQRLIEVEQGIVFVDLAQGTGKMSAARCAVGSLFRRFAVEAFVVGFRIGAGMVDNAVPMIRRRLERMMRMLNCSSTLSSRPASPDTDRRDFLSRATKRSGKHALA
jgi:hypothetical protein